MRNYIFSLLTSVFVFNSVICSTVWGEANPDQYQLGQAQAAGSIITKKAMIKSLDIRLQKLKSTEPTQFTKEMWLQKEFSQSVESFCQVYYKLVENGSSAEMCTSLCYQYLYSFRNNQAISINKKNLYLKPNKNKALYTKSIFSKFSQDFCNIMPNSIWKSNNTPHDCSELVLQGVEIDISGLVYNPEDEGNVCATFGVPN